MKWLFCLILKMLLKKHLLSSGAYCPTATCYGLNRNSTRTKQARKNINSIHYVLCSLKCIAVARPNVSISERDTRRGTVYNC